MDRAAPPFGEPADAPGSRAARQMYAARAIFFSFCQNRAPANRLCFERGEAAAPH